MELGTLKYAEVKAPLACKLIMVQPGSCENRLPV